MAGETPPRSSRQGNNSPLSPSDLTAARTAVEEAYKLIRVTDIDDTEGMAQRNQTYQEAMAAYSQLKAAVEANASAAAAAAAADTITPPPASPVYRDARETDGLIRQAVDRATHGYRQDIKAVREELARVTAGHAAPPVEGASGKHPPSPPKFNGVRGPGKLTIEAWLLQFIDWCSLHSVPAHKRVSYAVQALEGDAVQNLYNLKRVMLADGRDPDSWDIFKAGMIAGYAEVSPDIYVRTHLSKLKQTGSVQLYYEKFTAVLSQADRYPVSGAEAVWHFKQGLSERIRTAIAGSSDDNLHAVAVQAKRVDAELSLHVAAPAIKDNTSAPTNKASGGAAAKRNSAGGTYAGAVKKAKVDGPSGDLIKLRLKEGMCTNCNVPKANHSGGLGQQCTAPFVAADDEQVKALAKGKGKA